MGTGAPDVGACRAAAELVSGQRPGRKQVLLWGPVHGHSSAMLAPVSCVRALTEWLYGYDKHKISGKKLKT